MSHCLGMDSVFLHCNVVLDIILCHRHILYYKGPWFPSGALPLPGMGSTSCHNKHRIIYSLYTQCYVSIVTPQFWTYRTIRISSLKYLICFSCHNLTSISSAIFKILPNYCATYLPIAIIMIVNPVMYVLASKNIEMAVALPLAQVGLHFLDIHYSFLIGT